MKSSLKQDPGAVYSIITHFTCQVNMAAKDEFTKINMTIGTTIYHCQMKYVISDFGNVLKTDKTICCAHRGLI